MRKVMVGLMGVGLLLSLMWVGYRANTAHTQNLVDVPPVQVVVFFPEEEKSNDALLRAIGAPTLLTSDPMELTQFVATQQPNAIVIHAAITDKLDSTWLRAQYDAGTIIGGVNMLRTELKQFLGLPTIEGEVLPPFIQPPYMAYLYERGSHEEGWGGWGSGITMLEKPDQFVSFVQRVEENEALNRYYREEAQKESENNENQ